ncbi:hypothetical protein DMX02_05595 [Pseudomonas jessenii]|nr:hypothetical protein DMX02_05595 [Pseudomonas jessenii]
MQAREGGKRGQPGLASGSAIDTKPCGSWLASDSGVSGNEDVESTGHIAGKPAPTEFAVLPARSVLRLCVTFR